MSTTRVVASPPVDQAMDMLGAPRVGALGEPYAVGWYTGARTNAINRQLWERNLVLASPRGLKVILNGVEEERARPALPSGWSYVGQSRFRGPDLGVTGPRSDLALRHVPGQVALNQRVRIVGGVASYHYDVPHPTWAPLTAEEAYPFISYLSWVRHAFRSGSRSRSTSAWRRIPTAIEGLATFSYRLEAHERFVSMSAQVVCRPTGAPMSVTEVLRRRGASVMIFSTATELTTVRLSQPAPRADELADITTYGLDVQPELVTLRKKVVYAGYADAAPPRFRPAILAARVRRVRPKLRGPAYCDVM